MLWFLLFLAQFGHVHAAWSECSGGYPYCGYDGCSNTNYCTDDYSWKATCEAAGSSYQWCAVCVVSFLLRLSKQTIIYTQPMWTPLQPVGRCRLADNDSGNQNTDYVRASGTISSILDCIDACIADGDDCVAIEYSAGYCELWRSLPVMTQNTESDDENCLLKGDQLGVENAGQECWGACGSQQGACSDFCGKGGRCCRFGYTPGNGCNADDGVDTSITDLHLCVRVV